MIMKNKERLLSFLICSILLIFCMFIEEPNIANVFSALFGGSEFFSIFDRIKFFLPIALLTLLSIDYSSHSLKIAYAYTLPRYKDRTKWFNKIIADLLLINLFVIFSLIIIGIVVGILFNVNLKELWQGETIFLIVIAFFLYNLITFLQLFISIKYGTSVSFLVIITLTIASTYVSNTIFKFALLIPIGIANFHTGFYCSISSIGIMILINYILYKIILNVIKKMDLG